jgi:PAS domain S-box-containing protein
MDITERKHAEQTLFDITSRNEAILRATPDMMFLHDKDGVYLDYYTRDPAQLLLPPASFIGRSAREVLPEELAKRVMDSFARLDNGDQPQVLEYSLHIGGEERHYEARIVTVHTNHVLSIIRDVTKERRAVEAARHSQEKLLQSNKQIRDLAARLITAQESERRRISLLLHDDVNQNIAVMGMGISWLKSKVRPSNKELMNELEVLERQARSLTAQIRDLSHNLHPGILEHLGLEAALTSHVTDLKHKEQIEATFTARVGTEPIPSDVAVCLYRVALEALHNASRHSGATSAKIELRDENGFLTLEVSDSGRGFDVEKARKGPGIGLASSEERIRLLQGSFEVRSNSQTGTVLIARVPRSGP